MACKSTYGLKTWLCVVALLCAHAADSPAAVSVDVRVTFHVDMDQVSTYYVNDGSCVEPDSLCTAPGDDAHDGVSPATPMRHIQALLNRYPGIGAGKTVRVDPGAYFENISIGAAHAGLNLRGAGAGKSTLDGGAAGSVIVCDGFVTGEITGFTIQNGRAAASPNDSGGGVRCVNGSGPLIGENIIKGNAGSWGAAMASTDSAPTIRNCVLCGNTSAGGAALWCAGSENPAIVNCTIADNAGGGIAASSPCAPAITNCVVWTNGVALSGCAAAYSCIEGGGAGTGDIALNPRFADPANGDYRLQAGSPCIDSADGSAAPATDKDGNARADDPGMPNVGIGPPWADMGACEFQGATCFLSVQAQPPTGLSIGSSTGHGGTTDYTAPGIASGTSVNLQAPATDPAGYAFSQWTLNGTAQTPGQKSVTFTVTADTAAVAQYTMTLAVQSTPPAAILISSTTGHGGTTNYAKNGLAFGTSVNLQAPAADPAGYIFSQWRLNGTAQAPGQKTINFTMPAAAISAVAEYQLVTYALNVQSTPITGISVTSPTGHCGLTNCSLDVAPGTPVTLSAQSGDPAGYCFLQWRLNGTAQTPGQKTISFTTGGAATTAVAEYQLLTCALTVQSIWASGVSISSTTGHGGTANYCIHEVAFGTAVTLTAPAADPAGYKFVQWQLGGTAQAPGQKTIGFTMNAATTATVQYAPLTSVLSVQSTPVSGVIIASSTASGGTTNYQLSAGNGTRVYLRVPDADPAGYVFARWRVNGTAQPAGQKIIIFVVNGAATAVAEYNVKP